MTSMKCSSWVSSEHLKQSELTLVSNLSQGLATHFKLINLPSKQHQENNIVQNMANSYNNKKKDLYPTSSLSDSWENNHSHKTPYPNPATLN